MLQQRSSGFACAHTNKPACIPSVNFQSAAFCRQWKCSQPRRAPAQRLEYKWSPTQTAASSSSTGAGGDSHAGHAILHDFCMSIPYGAIALVGAVALWFVSAATQPLAGPTAAAGFTTLASSVLSLKEWKQGNASTPFTAMAAAAAGGVAYLAYGKAAAGIVQWLTWPLAILSACLSLFCLYNIAAGGNPPRKLSN